MKVIATIPPSFKADGLLGISLHVAETHGAVKVESTICK